MMQYLRYYCNQVIVCLLYVTIIQVCPTSVGCTYSVIIIISTPDGTEWIEDGGLLLGTEEDQDPYRGELGSQLGLVAITTGILLPNELRPTLTLDYDGLFALNEVGMDRNK